MKKNYLSIIHENGLYKSLVYNTARKLVALHRPHFFTFMYRNLLPACDKEQKKKWTPIV
jgi:hypothetical protein